jgi:hypothetical protein
MQQPVALALAQRDARGERLDENMRPPVDQDTAKIEDERSTR